MLKKLTFAALVMVCLGACNSKSGSDSKQDSTGTDKTIVTDKEPATTAFDYSQNVVKREKSLLPDINTTEENVGRYIAAKQWDSVSIAGEKMEKIVDATLNEIKNEPTPDFKEAANFKVAIVNYFEYIKSMYTGYKHYGDAKTASARAAELENLRKIIDGKTASIQAMQDMQQKFASANGFRIEDK